MEENSMENPFLALKDKQVPADERKRKRDALYKAHSSMVNEVLDELIRAYRPGFWKKGSDASHPYCCHVGWYAGPEETYRAGYDQHHHIRRCIDIVLEVDAACRPTGFKVFHHNVHKCAVVGFSRDELVSGILTVFDCEFPIFLNFQKE
jgi:hypothetical protein